MSKMLKILFFLGVLVTFFITPLNHSVNAQTSNLSSEIVNLMDDNPVPGLIIKDITREEYVQNVADNEGISYDEADSLVHERTSRALESLNKKEKFNISPLANPTWRQASWIQTYVGNASYRAEMQASFEVYGTGSFKQITNSSVGSSLASGIYTTSWSQSNSWKTTKYPVTEATVGVTGKFYSTVNFSTGVSGGIPGFTVSGTTSKSVTYVSNSMTIQRVFKVY